MLSRLLPCSSVHRLSMSFCILPLSSFPWAAIPPAASSSNSSACRNLHCLCWVTCSSLERLSSLHTQSVHLFLGSHSVISLLVKVFRLCQSSYSCCWVILPLSSLFLLCSSLHTVCLPLSVCSRWSPSSGSAVPKLWCEHAWGCVI